MKWILLFCVFLASSLHGLEVSGESFPPVVTIDQARLEATGASTRKKLIINVYAIAHYLQEGSKAAGPDKFQQILESKGAKQFTLKFLRNVDVDNIQKAYRESFQKNLSSAEFAKLQKEIDLFVSFFNSEAKKGDVFTLQWLPSGKVIFQKNDAEVGSIDNADFAKALWNIWLGPSSIVDRNQLVSLMK